MIQFFNAAVIAEILALLASLFFLTHKKAGYWRLFILFLVFTLLAEAIGFYFKTNQIRNHDFYNLFMMIQAGFFGFLFYKFNTSRGSRLATLTALALFLFFYMIEGTVRSFAAYQKNSRLLLSAIVVFLSCSFYFAMLRNDEIKRPTRYPPFWIVTGLFFYYFGTAVIFSFYDRVSQIKLLGNLSFYDIVLGCLSSILYGTWIIGFLWKKQIPSSRPL